MVSRVLVVLAGGALLVGCSAAASSAPRAGTSSVPAADDALALRVCGAARQAAATALGSPLSLHIVGTAASDVQCVLSGGQVTVTVESQAGPRAYAEFDTTAAHQSQVFGNGGAHDPAQDPVPVTVPGSKVAVWIPAQKLVVATDSTPDNGGAGAYVTVTVSGPAAPAKTALRVARAAGGATFAAHPDGPA